MGVISTLTNLYQPCIDSCAKCAQACRECFMLCLKEPDVADRTKCISILNECSMMCHSSVAMMTMVGQASKQHCALCAELCDKCAAECEMFKDNHCIKCAQICRECAEECRKMAAM